VQGILLLVILFLSAAAGRKRRAQAPTLEEETAGKGPEIRS
jgi:hypothetical protein